MSPYSFMDYGEVLEPKESLTQDLVLFFIFCIFGLCIAIPTAIIKFVDCLIFLWKWGHNAFDLVNVSVDTF